MGVFSKIKDLFFEETYVEVEEEEIRKPVVKPEVKKDKVTVAKKIDLPEIKKERIKEEIKEELEEELEEDFEDELPVEKQENKFKFPMTFEEEDFKQDDEEPVVKEEIKKVIKEEPKIVKEEPPKYIFENERVPLYEGREEKKEKPVFRPTPIISPIYGILDKNYKKDDVVTKKPVILSSTSSRKMDLDRVREKAYGDLASDITASMQEEKIVEEVKEEIDEKENTFYDLNIDSPAVERVTVGDAEEYFNDLGLEYNVDYKDNSMERVTGRRSSKHEVKDDEEDNETPNEDVSLENNLFDLIESMYEDKEE